MLATIRPVNLNRKRLNSRVPPTNFQPPDPSENGATTSPKRTLKKGTLRI